MKFALHEWIRLFGAGAVIVGFIMFLVGSPVMFSGHEVDCGGEAMHPGEVCGPNAMTGGGGRSYHDVARDDAIERGVGYGGLALIGASILSIVIAESKRRDK